MPEETTCIDELVAGLGGGVASRLARLLDVRPQTIHHWRRRGEIPLEYSVAIESATQGRYTVAAMSPNATIRIRATVAALADSQSAA
jgi:DNA-binding transcriptional regulator YdaS (Cro superfamily)